MQLDEIRSRYLEFFKARGHAVIPSAPLVPENDPTTLFTGSGMQPLIPYLLGEKHPLGTRLTNSQKSFRAEDIEEVGDNRHTTFFEMLGNWSLGDYFKAEQLPWFFEFLTDKEKGVGLDPARLYVTVFAGDEKNGIPKDTESVEIWKRLFENAGVKDVKDVELLTEEHASEVGMQGGRIFYYTKKNWWSRAGIPDNMPVGEPGGPDSEVFYDFGLPHDPKFGKECHPNCDCGRFMEIGNSVFMEYKRTESGFEKLSQRNVDFGGGLERIAAASNNDPDVFHLEIFETMARAMGVEIKNVSREDVRKVRIILDHLRASVFLVGDGVEPSNKAQGYVVRRLLRRSALFARSLSLQIGWIEEAVRSVAAQYALPYPELHDKQDYLVQVIVKEFNKFNEVVEGGIKEFDKRVAGGVISGKDAFDLYQSYGFPWELTEELATNRGINVNRKEFEEEFKKHRDLSRTASAGQFKGGLADASEKTTRLHTAHHLLLKALQMVLNADVKQRGSNINQERLRIDFSYGAKVTPEEIAKVEKIVNEKIAEDLPVIRSEMPREEAEKIGAEHEFGAKYPDRVSVYSVGPKDATLENPHYTESFSIEFCGGPHVTRTGEIGKFKIQKEEASSAGIRRIKAIVE